MIGLKEWGPDKKRQRAKPKEKKSDLYSILKFHFFPTCSQANLLHPKKEKLFNSKSFY
jgi:hypothetical protein